MRYAAILSPHRDDAAFSLCLSLASWGRRQIQLRVINFFTVSGYGPWCAIRDVNGVSRTRKREDRKALARISPAIEVIDLGLPDAPIRLGVPTTAVCDLETQSLDRNDQANALAKQIPRFVSRSLLFAPLGLGNHVDHLLVRAAAMLSARSHRLAFYEDLPYATWTTSKALKMRVEETEHCLGSSLKAVVIKARNAIPRKRRFAATYQSQITRVEADNIARWTTQYSGAERIWVPAGSRTWSSFLRDN